MKKIALMSLAVSSVLFASGYKIPETSTNSVALSGANIAHTKSADAAYDNPANMIFMSDSNHIEADLMYIGTSATKFEGTVDGTGPYDLSAEEQTFLIPSIHYVSPKLGEANARVGLSIVVPGGLTREWKEEPAKTSAEEFTLQIVEINPTAAFEVTKEVAFAVGFRIVHTSGVVKSSGTVPVTAVGGLPTTITRDMEGDSLDFGYNLALAYQPTSNLEIGLTYRSKVDLSTQGDASLSSTAVVHPNPAVGTLIPAGLYSGGAAVSVPLPATFSAAIAYTLPTNTTVEFVYEKAYWSAYENLDFSYDTTLTHPILNSAFDKSIAKNWKDTESYRFGITQELDSLTLMAGAVIDNTPTPESSLNFESPGSDSLSVSLGGRYEISKTIDV
ncbi:MAG: outer membrane protein transport protein, partial [Campylobacterota bacterium]|nr:outer membrane protein transport protein [Campylobacterota bacterium]